MDGPYIELQILLKIKGIVSTGGQAKVMIQAGEVFVNGQIETRVRRKLIVGDAVFVASKSIMVTTEMVR